MLRPGIAPRAIHTATLLLGLGLWAAQPCLASGTEPERFGGDLKTPRSLHTATLLANGRVLLAGGNAGGVINGAESYNPPSNSWRGTGSLNESRYFHGTVRLSDGRVLTAGGQGFGANDLISAEIYDLATGKWTFTAEMSIPRSAFDPILLPNGKVLVAGGFSNGAATASAELYDPATGSWAPTGSLGQPRGAYRATLLPNGKVLIAGGGNGSIFDIAETELYDPSTGNWSNTGSVNVPRTRHTQVLLADGRVLIAGGQVPEGSTIKVLGAAEIYDPATSLWTRTGFLRIPRMAFTATLLADGKVFATGGGDSSFAALASIEEYNPATGKWRLLERSLANAREFHTTTRLLDDSLIVAGGSNPSDPVPTAELFVQPR